MSIQFDMKVLELEKQLEEVKRRVMVLETLMRQQGSELIALKPHVSRK